MDSKLTLYYWPQTRANRARWTLEELGLPYELVRVDLTKGEHKQPDYLRIHPLGAVPALKDGDTTLIESVAICMYLADRAPEKKLAPPVGSVERGRYYQWMLFATASIEAALVQYFSHVRALPEEKRIPTVAADAKKSLEAALRVVENALAGKEYLLDSGFSAADIIISSGLIWGSMLGILEGFPNLQAYVERIKARPALARARAD